MNRGLEREWEIACYQVKIMVIMVISIYSNQRAKPGKELQLQIQKIQNWLCQKQEACRFNDFHASKL